jgi:WD40 repeat protein
MRAPTGLRVCLVLAGAAALQGAASGAAAPTAVADETDPGNFGPAWSPDGSRIALYSGRDGGDWVRSVEALA